MRYNTPLAAVPLALALLPLLFSTTVALPVASDSIPLKESIIKLVKQNLANSANDSCVFHFFLHCFFP
jgi:hypothetical protein